jgi:hypothetical protein
LQPARPVPHERPARRPDQGIASEALVEAARVVVEREHEPRETEGFFVGGADDDAAVRPLSRERDTPSGQRAAPDTAPRDDASR